MLGKYKITIEMYINLKWKEKKKTTENLQFNTVSIEYFILNLLFKRSITTHVAKKQQLTHNICHNSIFELSFLYYVICYNFFQFLTFMVFLKAANVNFSALKTISLIFWNCLKWQLFPFGILLLPTLVT